MKVRSHRVFLPALGIASWLVTVPMAQADAKDTIGLTDLLTRYPILKGAGFTVAQVEASTSGSAEIYHVDPSEAGLASSKFTYFDSMPGYPASSAFNPAQESNHADQVANGFFDLSTGVAPEVDAIKVFNANNFFNDVINPEIGNVGASVINQSYTFGNETAAVDRKFDHYADEYGVVFANSVSNDNGPALSPATSYNCISVGELNLTHSGAVSSNGRVIMNLIAPGNRTSYATPYVAGSATLMKQAASLNHGGAGTATDAADPRVIKALLLNGAVKNSSWSPQAGEPLDRKSGAGILNVNNAHLQLEGGTHSPNHTEDGTTGGLYTPPSGIVGNVSSLKGWNFVTMTNNFSFTEFEFEDRVENYYFDLPGTSSFYDATATITWHQRDGETDINNLDLYLYNADTGVLISSSASSVDNVEHIFKTDLPAGRYALQIVKREADRISTDEPVAFAFNFEPSVAPTAPTGLAATATSESTISLTWNDNDNTETAYRVERSLTTATGFVTIANLPANSESYTDNGLSQETQYFYRVVAIDALGEAVSNEANATTLDMIQAWRYAHFTDPANSGDGENTADPDGDGLANLVEYAIGTDPNDPLGAQGATAGPTVQIVEDGGSQYLQLTVNRLENKADLIYTVQMGDDIDGWADATVTVGDTPTQLVVRGADAVLGNTKQFARLKVTLAP